MKIFTARPQLPTVLNYLILEYAGLVFCGRTNSVFVINFPRLVKPRQRRPRFTLVNSVEHDTEAKNK